MKHLRELLNELKRSKFECVAGYLENHTAFIALEAKVDDNYVHCCLGAKHPCALNVNDGYCVADVCQYQARSL